MENNTFYYDKPEIPQELPRIEGFLEDDIRAFVGAYADKYIERFRRIANGEKPYSWSCAIFLTYWMAYRKMVKPAILFTFMLGLINRTIPGFNFWLQMMCHFILILFYFVYMGREGNVLYWNFVKETLTKEGLADISQPDYNKRAALGRKGGTSLLYLFVFIVLSSMISSL